jgi:hypothetical protein
MSAQMIFAALERNQPAGSAEIQLLQELAEKAVFRRVNTCVSA